MNAVAHDIERAAEAVRSANHASMRGPLTAPETYDVVGVLVQLLARLPQVLDYLARSLRRADPGEHFDDRGTDPARTVDQARDGLLTVGDDLHQLVRQLSNTHNHLSHIGQVITEED